MLQIAIIVAATKTREDVSIDTPAMGRARFERMYRKAHGDNAPDEVHTAPLWAGPDSATAHEALCAELAEDAQPLGLVVGGDGGYALMRGWGDGCDVWVRFND